VSKKNGIDFTKEKKNESKLKKRIVIMHEYIQNAGNM
jgi:hypothetical protein